MKKITVLLSTLLTVFVFACTEQTKQFTVDTVNIDEQTVNLTETIARSVIVTDDAKLAEKVQAFNAEVEAQLNTLRERVRQQADMMLAVNENNDMMAADSVVMNYLNVTDEVFRADSRYISLILKVRTLMEGAGEITESYAFNYDVKTGNFLANSDILNAEKKEQIDAALQGHFENHEACFTAVPTFESVTAVNFNADSVVFTYDPGILGAQECGGARIVVPVAELGDAFIVK